jgi:hypothetical protein
MLTKLDTPYVYFEIKNNILFATYKKGLRIDLQIAKEIVQQRLEFMEARELPVIVFDDGVISISKEARDYFGSEEGNRNLKAGAIIKSTPFAAAISSFFLFVTKPSIPARAFRSERAALKWLSKFVK